MMGFQSELVDLEYRRGGAEKSACPHPPNRGAFKHPERCKIDPQATCSSLVEAIHPGIAQERFASVSWSFAFNRVASYFKLLRFEQH